MAALTSLESNEAQRVEDYLDDQIGDVRDLAGIDLLIARVEDQQALLQRQLEDAQKTLLEVEKNAVVEADDVRSHAEHFQKQQSQIDRQMQEISYSSTTDDAVRTFESRMEKLHRLEVATGYLELMRQVDRLQSGIPQLLVTDPRTAVERCTSLRRLRQSLDQAHLAAEGAASQLVLHVEKIDQAVHAETQRGLVKRFQSTLEKMKWPQKELNMLGGVLDVWSEECDLQLEIQESEAITKGKPSEADEIPALLPLEVMIQPLAQRFRYHFYGDKPTNRLDKPEFFLSHVLDLLDRHSGFMVDYLQPLLDQRNDENDRLVAIYPDAISAFITALLPMVVNKSKSLLTQISSHPQLLAHFMSELMTFDNTLRESWNYSPAPADLTVWRGLTWTILDTHGYFDQWLKVEKNFALSRYRTIRDAPDSGDIDYEGVEPGQTKPTNGAVRVNDLLETITDRYRGLSSFSQKIKFLIEIQLSIFDDYHSHLHGALQVYLASSHTASRVFQGQFSKHEAFDQRALASLCKVYGSAAFLERKMSDWSDDIFFLELWEELQDRAQSGGGSNATVGKDLRILDVAAKTSGTITKSIDQTGYDGDGGALFDETAASYRRLKDSSEGDILHLLDVNVKEAIGPFSKLEVWASLSSSVADPVSLSPSSALDALLQVTSVLLGFLAKVLARPPLRKMVKHFCVTAQNEIIGGVLMAHNFSTAGLMQVRRDVMAIENAIDTASGISGLAESCFMKLEQAIRLMNLPIKISSNRETGEDAAAGDDAWGFDDTENNEQGPNDSSLRPTSSDDEEWGLWEAEKALFTDNETARRALKTMGLENLGEQEARDLLKRRIELSS